MGEAARSGRHPALPSVVLVPALGQSWAGQPARAWAVFGPGPCPAVPGAVSSREGLSQRHRAGAGSCVAPCSVPGAASAPTPLPAPVNCRVSFLLPCPGTQCIHSYSFCLLWKLLYRSNISHGEETAVLRSCKAQDSVFSWALGAQKHDMPCWVPGRWHGPGQYPCPRHSESRPVTAAWLLTASQPREQRSGKAQLWLGWHSSRTKGTICFL